MALNSDKYKKNMQDGAKATKEAAASADELKQNIKDALFFARDYADEAKKLAKEVMGSTIAASETAKAFKDVAKAAKAISDEYAEVLSGEKKYADLIKERQTLNQADKGFQTEYEQFLSTILSDQTQINNALAGGLDVMEMVTNAGADLTNAQYDLLQIYQEQNQQLLDEKDNLDEIERRAKNIEDAMSFGESGAVGIEDIAEGTDAVLDKLGMGGLKDKLGLGDAVKDARKYAAELTNGGTNIDKMGKPIDTAGQSMKVMSRMAGNLGKNLMKSLGPMALLAMAVDQVVDAFKLIDSSSGEIAKAQGISAAEASKQVGYANQQALMSGNILMSTKDILAAQTSLNKIVGTSVQFSGEMATQFANIQERTGLSGEAMAMFAKNALKGKGSIEDQMQDVSDITMSLNQQNGVTMNIKDIQEGIGKLTASQRLTARGNTEELSRQVYQSKLLGLSASQLEGVQNSLLDFESSIAAEMEAELMTGKQLNLEGARAAALAGDQAALAAELRKEVGSIAEFEEMNVMQRESLAKAFGLNVDQMAEMLSKQETLEAIKDAGFKSQSDAQSHFNKLVDEGMSAEQASAEMKRLGIDGAFAAQMKSASASEKMAAAQERLTDLFVALVEPLMPLIQAIVDLVSPLSAILSPIFALVGEIVGLVMDVLQPILTIFTKNLTTTVEGITDLFGGLKDIVVGIFTLDTAKILGGFKKIGSGLYKIFVQPIDDFKDTIENTFNDVFDFLSTIGSNFIGSFSDEFIVGFKNMANIATKIILFPLQTLLDVAINAFNAIIKGANKVPGVDMSLITTPDLAGAVALAEGGIAPATPGGISAIVGEGGEAEAIIPLSKAGEMGFGGSDMTETNKLLKQLISAVNSGGDVFLDGNKVGKSLAIATSDMG